MSEHELGPLPKSSYAFADLEGDEPDIPAFSADQMRAYALAEVRRAVEMEQERWRGLLLEALNADTNDYIFGSDLADRMRAALVSKPPASPSSLPSPAAADRA